MLGASGCGKTTLISCLIGRRKLHSGNIFVFGKRPNTKEFNDSCLRIGYMPQVTFTFIFLYFKNDYNNKNWILKELGLYEEFTLRETLTYFGWIGNLPTDTLETRIEFLLKMFELFDFDKFVNEFSAGQKRRVSLAVALLHEPELLLLDEPTVGSDPILRQIIWKHFEKIVKSGNRTIILTTHYIEEVKNANLVRF